VVRNDTEHAFQLRTSVGERYLHGQLRTDGLPEHAYAVEARGEQFLRRDGQVFRRNQIWRRVLDRSGRQVGEEMVRSNCALVVYEPGRSVDVIDLD
jgi:vancomycin resistance protein VanW